MKPVLLTTSALLLSSTASMAAPTVTGNTVSWPDDGWYQVQDEADYSEVCAGGRSCEIGDSSYVVINHTTGQRFPRIRAGDSGGGSSNSIAVSGNTISWPDDGWYQVQRSDTYESICGGGQSCEVADGNYIVINHTTGERFTDISVPADDADDSDIDLPDVNVGHSIASPSNGVTVDGYTISWPDDGWYQVQFWNQFENNYENICSGVRSCTIDTGGTYMVINHDTGTRTRVDITQTLNTFSGSNYEAVIAHMLGVYTGSGIGYSHAPDFADTLADLPDIEHEQGVDSYLECEYGGTATISYFSTDIDTGYDYEFDACERSEYDGLYGSIIVMQTDSERVVIADNFRHATSPVSTTFNHGSSHRSEGAFSVSDFSLTFGDTHGLGAYLTDADYSWNRSINNNGAFSNHINGSFNYSQRGTANGRNLTVVADNLSVELTPQQTANLGGDFSQVYPVTGTLEVISEVDDSRILLNAATGDSATVSITIENNGKTTALMHDWSKWDSVLRLDEVGQQ